MKNYLLSFFFLLLVMMNLFHQVTAQNLVPNPSFEDTVSCPNGISEIDRAVDWSSYSITPDYFNTCSTYNGGVAGVPNNQFGSQYPFNGNAYAGLVTFTAAPNTREFIGAQLTQPLTIGVRYFVSVYVSKADVISESGATNNFGFTFFTTPYSYSNPAPINNFSHVHSDSIITDANNWTRVSGSFIADQTYQYIGIGNFYDDAHTDTSNTALEAYYYIDEVCVSTDSLTCLIPDGIEQQNKNLSSVIFPNPFTTQLQIQYTINQPGGLVVYDALGRKVKSYSLPSNQKTFQLSLAELPAGVYLVTINSGGQSFREKVVKQ